MLAPGSFGPAHSTEVGRNAGVLELCGWRGWGWEDPAHTGGSWVVPGPHQVPHPHSWDAGGQGCELRQGDWPLDRQVHRGEECFGYRARVYLAAAVALRNHRSCGGWWGCRLAELVCYSWDCAQCARWGGRNHLPPLPAATAWPWQPAQIRVLPHAAAARSLRTRAATVCQSGCPLIDPPAPCCCSPLTLITQGKTVKGRVLLCADGSTSRLATQLGYCTEPPQGVSSRCVWAGWLVGGGIRNVGRAARAAARSAGRAGAGGCRPCRRPSCRPQLCWMRHVGGSRRLPYGCGVAPVLVLCPAVPGRWIGPSPVPVTSSQQ